jgi:hypothetical protein
MTGVASVCARAATTGSLSKHIANPCPAALSLGFSAQVKALGTAFQPAKSQAAAKHRFDFV